MATQRRKRYRGASGPLASWQLGNWNGSRCMTWWCLLTLSCANPTESDVGRTREVPDGRGSDDPRDAGSSTTTSGETSASNTAFEASDALEDAAVTSVEPSASPSSEPPATPVCTEGVYDDDDDPMTECKPLTVCREGYYVQLEGTPSSDRRCTTCSPGSFSAEENAPACEPWATCGWTEVETLSPNPTRNRVCSPGSEYRLLPAPATSVAVDHQGNVIVGMYGGILRKYDANGHETWDEDVSIIGSFEDISVTVDSLDNVLVAASNLSWGQTELDKYTPEGKQLWHVRAAEDYARPVKPSFVAVDQHDNAVIAGTSELNPFVSKYDREGKRVWTERFPAGPVALARGVAVDGRGNLWVVGDTNGNLKGPQSEYPGALYLSKYDPNGSRSWLDQYGSPGPFQEAFAVAVDEQGNAFAGGLVGWSGMGPDGEAIVRKYTSDGTALWTRQFANVHDGKAGARALAVDEEGSLFVACNSVTLDAGTGSGVVVRKYDGDGGEVWTRFATGHPEALHSAEGIAVDATGRVFVVGSLRSGDATSGFVWLVPAP